MRSARYSDHFQTPENFKSQAPLNERMTRVCWVTEAGSLSAFVRKVYYGDKRKEL